MTLRRTGRCRATRLSRSRFCAAWSYALLVLAVCQFPSSARAELDQDAGLWLMALGQGRVGAPETALAKWRWWLDMQPRFTEDAGGFRQALVRPGLGYALDDDISLWLGYAWVRTEQPRGGHTDEHRIWQQLLWTPKIGQLGLASRTRLEQRFLVHANDTGWRFRQFFKATYPVGFRDRLFLSAYDELFFDLNDTDWGQRTGFSQNRLFAGLGWSIDGGGRVRVEAGYLNQFLSRTGADRMNHILSLNLFLNFNR